MSIRKKMLLVLVYPMGKGAAGRPVQSLGPACSSSSQCHDLLERTCWAVPWRKVLTGGGVWRTVSPFLPSVGQQVQAKSQQGFLLRVFLERKSMLKRYEWGRNIIPECLKISIFPGVL